MTTLLERAGASFLRAFAVTFITFAAGIWLAPNLDTAVALAIAAAGASLAAALRALQVFVPQFSWSVFLSDTASAAARTVAAWADSFTRAFVGFAVVGFAAWFDEWDPTNWRTITTSVLLGALAAGSRAVQGLLTGGELPGKAFPAANPA